MTDGEGETPLEDSPSRSTATLVAPRPDADGTDKGEPGVHSETDSTGRHLTYNPAIDGIRGLAVGAVLLFHGGFGWARGGYLGVSTFFTLSGFLITSLVLAEHRSTGNVEPTAFWARRLRRLLPAAVATLAVIMVSAVFTNEQWERTLGGDVIAAALNVANWRFLFEEQSYAALFESPSPVLHFWSLAIEEQFYWVFPLLSLAVLRLGRGSLRTFGAVLGGLLVLSGVLTLLNTDDQSVVYYSTPIRMGEILVGALLATAVAQGRLVGERDRKLVPLFGVLGGLALLASVWAWMNVEQATPSLYEGGLLAYAAVSGCLVLAACVPGPVQRALSFEPLRLLGLISYGVYLIHWPVFLILDGERAKDLLDPFNVNPSRTVLFILRLAVTLVLSLISFRLLEQPIRRGRRPSRWPAPPLALGAVASVVLLAVVVPEVSEPPPDPFAGMVEARLGLDPSQLAPDARIGITLTDSTGLVTSFGLSEWGARNQRLMLVGGGGGVGCSIGHGGEVEYLGLGWSEIDVDTRSYCARWSEDIQAAAECARDRYGRLDLAVIQGGPWDVANRRLEGSDEVRVIGEDPEYDEFLRHEMEAAVDELLAEGATVVWLTAPHLRTPHAEAEPARMDRFNDMVRDLAAEREGVVVVELGPWVDNMSPEENDRMRPDGIHFTNDGPDSTTIEVADRFLGEEVIRASTQERSPSAPDVWPPLPPDEPVPDSCPPQKVEDE